MLRLGHVAILFPSGDGPRRDGSEPARHPLFIALLHPRVFRPLSSWALRRLHREPLDVTLGSVP